MPPRAGCRSVAALGLVLGAGCGFSGGSSSGLESVLRVAGAQAMSGSIADPPAEIPAVVAPSTRWNTVYPGVSNKSIKGVVGPDANAVAIGVPGDAGYWLLPGQKPDSVDPSSNDFSATFSVSPELAQSALVQTNPDDGTSTLTLAFRGVDGQGRFGTATTLPMAVQLAQPSGTLVVSLLWDSPVDLDLHVLVPAPVTSATPDGYLEVWSKKPAADASAKDGLLDRDSNAACAIDNQDQEDVVWQGTPPSGRYLVRVEAFSLCGLPSAQWVASAMTAGSAGAPLAEVSGVVTEASTRGAHGPGAGLTAFAFEYP